MAGNVDLEIDQGADFGLQVIWTDLINEPYQVCHPMRLQARASTGQTLIDLVSVDQADEQPLGTSPTIVYSEEGGVIQVIIPSSITAQLPAGSLQYDLFVTYRSTSYNYVTSEETSATRLEKLIAGKITVNGRITKKV